MPERILVVEDEPHLRHFVAVHLRLEGYEVDAVSSGSDALALAHADPPDLVLLDIGLPDVDGLAVCRRLRGHARTAGVPVILVTGRAEALDKLAGLAAGANDYVLKPFDPLELVARARTTLERARELRTASPLTGLPGNARIHEELARRLRELDEFAVLYADINHFKAFNDRYGFARGDAAIRLTAQLAVDAVEGCDSDTGFVGHVGGDDFVLMCRASVTEAVCAQLLNAFDTQVPGLYDREDRERGWVELPDRQGTLRRFALLSLAVGVATTEHRRFRDHRELVAVAAEMKAFAKRSFSGSGFAVDDRRDATIVV
jgi:DNA-binding response OmpR family regulator